jgi:hypothetical protein
MDRFLKSDSDCVNADAPRERRSVSESLVPADQVPQRLYNYSLKLRDLLQTRIEQLESELKLMQMTLEQQQQELKELRTQQRASGRWARRWKVMARQHRLNRSAEGDDGSTKEALQLYSLALDFADRVPAEDVQMLLRTEAGRSLLQWREATLRARVRHQQAESAYTAMINSPAIPVKAMLYEQLVEAGDRLFDKIDAPVKIKKADRQGHE